MELEEYIRASTVRVESEGREGVGFFVAPGLIVTAAHLVEDPSGGDFPLSDVSVATPSWRARGRVVRYASAPEPDVAVIEVDQPAPATAYLYAPITVGDSLWVCGSDSDIQAAMVDLTAGALEGDVIGFDGSPGVLPEGAPVVNLRTGGVCGVVTRGRAEFPGSQSLPWKAATSVSVIARLFPDVSMRHDRHHVESPEWFGTTGVRGTVFAAREHTLATRDTCETPIQPLVTPVNGRGPMALLAPVAFQPPSLRLAPGRGGLQTSIDDVLDRSWANRRSILLTGPTGSGRSSVLRALGYRASSNFGNLGALGQQGLFPILLRANQLATDEGSVEDALLASMAQGNEVMTGMDLPAGFLTDIARSPGIRLLLMIDGMDEIQNSRDISAVVGLIGRIHEAPGFGPMTQLLVTARPSAAEHFRYAPFDVCEIQPLSDGAVRQAATHWLDEAGAQRFFEENSALVQSGLLSSPLVLAVALKLYESGPRALPAQVVALYRTLISNLAVHRRNELASKYSPEVADNAVELLGYVALELLRSATVMDETFVRSTAQRYFEKYLDLSEEQARERAASFTHFAAADSHFIGPAGSRFFWSHLSFRDYFAALCLVKTSPDGGAAREIRQRWFDTSWGRTPSFALQLLDDESARTGIIREVLASGREARFTFLTDLIREGAPLPAPIVSDFVAQLAARVRTLREEGPDGENDTVTFDLLMSLSRVPEAREAMQEFLAGAGQS